MKHSLQPLCRQAFSQLALRSTSLGRLSAFPTPFDCIFMYEGSERTWFGWPGCSVRSCARHISELYASPTSDRMYLHTLMCREGLPVDICIDLDHKGELNSLSNRTLDLLSQVEAKEGDQISEDFFIQRYRCDNQTRSTNEALTCYLGKLLADSIVSAVKSVEASFGCLSGQLRVSSLMVLQSSSDAFQKISVHIHARLERSGSSVAFADYKEMLSFVKGFVLPKLNQRLYVLLKDSADFPALQRKIVQMIDTGCLRPNGSIRAAFSHTCHNDINTERQLVPLVIYTLKSSGSTPDFTCRRIIEHSLVQRDPHEVEEFLHVSVDHVKKLRNKSTAPLLHHSSKHLASYRHLLQSAKCRDAISITEYVLAAPFNRRMQYIQRVILPDTSDNDCTYHFFRAIHYSDWLRISFLLSQLCEWELSFAMREFGLFLQDKEYIGINIESCSVAKKIIQHIEQHFTDFFLLFSKICPEKFDQSVAESHWCRVRRKHRRLNSTCHRNWEFFCSASEVKEQTLNQCLVSSPLSFHSVCSKVYPRVRKWSATLQDCFSAAHSVLNIMHRQLRKM